MSLSPTEILPEEYLYPNRLGDVLATIRKLYVDGDTKVDLLQGWARMVGVTLNASQYQSVRVTGTDRDGPTA